ncbi:hypothetical protein [Crenobacter cavernae]|uniref:Uncharacterized protein n=1 Tax=Crenobacter cavernae TaxID=2290923 RepID=A0A345Y889_9NEIS|nr:hypothetical protein [Crenobacter cavernae]AXK40141.1 hypothetical protein DWG20_12170 [Crenobacter cavernae]
MKARKQAGWYTGTLMFALIMVVVLFVAQPWIPLALLATLAVLGVIAAINHGIEAWKRHHPHDQTPAH